MSMTTRSKTAIMSTKALGKEGAQLLTEVYGRVPIRTEDLGDCCALSLACDESARGFWTSPMDVRRMVNEMLMKLMPAFHKVEGKPSEFWMKNYLNVQANISTKDVWAEKDYLAENHRLIVEEKYKKACAHVMKRKTWLGFLEITAYAFMCDVRVNVVSFDKANGVLDVQTLGSDEERAHWHLQPLGPAVPDANVLWLAYNGTNHFEPCLPKALVDVGFPDITSTFNHSLSDGHHGEPFVNAFAAADAERAAAERRGAELAKARREQGAAAKAAKAAGENALISRKRFSSDFLGLQIH